jgi:hypothetical protein
MKTCSWCQGKGVVNEMVEWSDGLGVAERVCDLCDGTKVIPDDLSQSYVNIKGRKYELEAALSALKTKVALYLTTSRGLLPNPPLDGASNPSADATTWLAYLLRDISNIERVTDGYFGEREDEKYAEIEEHNKRAGRVPKGFEFLVRGRT